MPNDFSPEEIVTAGITAAEEFDQALAAIKAEHDDLVKQTIKAGENRAIDRVRLWLKNIFLK